MALFDYVSLCVCYFVCFFFSVSNAVQTLASRIYQTTTCTFWSQDWTMQLCKKWFCESREHRRFLKDQETWVFLNVIAEQLSVSGQEASFLWFLDPRTPSYSIWDKWQSCLLHLSLVVFASFPSSFLSWSTPIIKLPIRPTWTEEKRGDKNVTLVVSQVRDIGTSFGIHDTKQFTNQTVIIKRQSEVHLQGLNSNTSHTLPLG